MTLKMKGPGTFWEITKENTNPYGNYAWALSASESGQSFNLHFLHSISNYESTYRLYRGSRIYRLDLGGGSSTQIEYLGYRPYGLAQKGDTFYTAGGKRVMKVGGGYLDLPESIGGLDYVSAEESGGQEFLIAIAGDYGSHRVYIISLDEDGDPGTVIRVLTIDVDYGSPLWPYRYTGVAYARIPWGGGDREVLYVCKDDWTYEPWDVAAIVDFETGEVLTVMDAMSSGIALSEPITWPNGVTSDYLSWANPQGLEYIDGRLFLVTRYYWNKGPLHPPYALGIDLEKDGPAIARAGDPIIYTYYVRNTGTVPLGDVSVEDNECGSASYVSGDDGNNLLDVSETWVFECTYTPSFTFPGSLTNTAVASGRHEGEEVEDTDTYTLYPFILRKEVYLYWNRPEDTVPYPDPDTEFQVQVEKDGEILTTITISKSSPAKLWLSEGTYIFREVDLPEGYLPGYPQIEYTTGEGYPDWTYPNIITFDLAIDKEGPGSARPEEKITYTYTVTNGGPASVEPAVSDDLCGAPTLTGGDSDGDGLVDPGETWTYACEYTVPSCAAGSLTNTANVREVHEPTGWVLGGDRDPTNNEDTWTLHIEPANPSIDVEKYVSVDGQETWHDADSSPGPSIAVGGEVYFKIVVTNDGDVTLTGITLVDSDLDLSGCFMPWSLAPGKSFECKVGPLTASAGQHRDTATATGTYCENTYSDTDDAYYLGAEEEVEKTFILILTANNPWKYLEYHGSVKPVGGEEWKDVRLERLDESQSGETVLTGTIGLEPGVYEWKIYCYTEDAEDEIVIASGVERIEGTVENEVVFGVTSLSVSKTVDKVERLGDNRYNLSGTITIQNDEEHFAVITDIADFIEYRDGNQWNRLEPDKFEHDTVSIIPPGGTVSLGYFAEFTLPPCIGFRGLRNRVEVTLFNHPGGTHVFHYTVSFEMPEDDGSDNHPPEAGNVHVEPPDPTVSHDLRASYDFYDADGDGERGTEIRWYRNGVHQKRYDGQLVIPSSKLRVGDKWYFTVRPCDGKACGEEVRSPEVTIAKAPTRLELTYEVRSSGSRRHVVLKARLIDGVTGGTILSGWRDYIYIQFYLDGSFIGQSRVSTYGYYRGYAIISYRVESGTHEAYAQFKGNHRYEPSKSQEVEFDVP